MSTLWSAHSPSPGTGFRYSGDIDILIRPSLENAELVLRAIAQFGFGNLAIAVSDLTTPGKVIQFGYEPNRIDLLTAITGVSFNEAWEERVHAHLDGVPVNFIGRSALLRRVGGYSSQPTISCSITSDRSRFSSASFDLKRLYRSSGT